MGKFVSPEALRAAEDKMVRDVSAIITRVVANLAQAPLQAAYQLNPETRHTEAFLQSAFLHAEMLDREARNMREVVRRAGMEITHSKETP